MTISAPPEVPVAAVGQPPAPSQNHHDRFPVRRILWAVMAAEFRQNLAIAALVLALEVIFYGYSELMRPGFFAQYRTPPLNVLLIEAVRAAIPQLCALAGLVLGIFQPLADVKFDRWAFMVHRPAPRSLLFAGRALAGLLLYSCVIGIPLLALILWALTPSGGEYFLWQYTIPPMVHFVTGVAYYFAGLLISQRSARFYGSRLVPLILAAVASIFTFHLSSAGWALLVSCVAILLLGAAALGSAVSHGYTLPAPRIYRAVLSIVVLLALSFLLFTPSVSAHFSDVALSNSAIAPRYEGSDYITREYCLLDNGTIVTRTVTGIGRTGNTQTTFTDAEGRNLATPDASRITPLNWYNFGSPPRERMLTYRELDPLVSVYTHDWPHPEHTPSTRIDKLYFDRTRRRIYIYNSGNREFVGTLGADGFVPPGRETRPFESPYLLEDSLLWTPRTIYSVNLQEYQARPVFSAPGGETIRERIETGSRLIVKTESAIYIMTRWGEKLLATIPLDGRWYSSTFPLPLKHMLAFEWRQPSSHSSDFHLDFYTEDGQLVSSTLLPPLPAEYLSLRGPTAGGYEFAFRHQLKDGALLAIGGPAALALADSAERTIPADGYTPSEGRYYLASLTERPRLFAFIAVLLVSSLIALGLAYAYRLPAKPLWMLLPLVAGPAGLLMIVSTQVFPPRIRCPNCKAKRPLKDPICPNCKSPWPTPPKTGTEIFT